MAIKYTCRYCGLLLSWFDTEFSDSLLGFNELTPLERQDIITCNANGDRQVRIICESCQELLERNPELSLLPNFYQ